MRALTILKQTLSPMLHTIHLIRCKAVFWAVHSLLQGRRLSLTSLGRSGANGSIAKHAIKRADRLLGNKHLHKELPTFYRAIAHTVLRDCLHPIILIDWTRIEPEHVALVAAVPLDGRSLPVYVEVHSEKKDSNPSVMRNFLQQLKAVLPANMIPIIVTDAGFRTGWFKAVHDLNWHFVGRMRNNHFLRRAGSDKWEALKNLYRFARSKPNDLGQWTVTQSNPFDTRIVTYRKRRYSKKPEPSIGSAKLKSRRKMKEPWILATSLQQHSAHQIVKIYSKRMQIEETFRDAKNHRFGWSFRHARSSDENRFAVLLLIGTLAMFVATLLGNAAEQKKIHYRFQANTIRIRRVLSLFFLGVMLIQTKDNNLLTAYELHESYQYIRQLPEKIDG